MRRASDREPTAMPLEPEEIANKEFVVGLRGYDKDEVRSFLQQIASELIVQANDATHPVAATADHELAEARDLATKVVAEALQEAGWIRTEAATEAELVRADAATVLAEAQAEALRLVADTRSFADLMADVADLSGAPGRAPAGTDDLAGLTDRVARLDATRVAVRSLLSDLHGQLDAAVEAVAAAERAAAETGTDTGIETAPSAAS